MADMTHAGWLIKRDGFKRKRRYMRIQRDGGANGVRSKTGLYLYYYAKEGDKMHKNKPIALDSSTSIAETGRKDGLFAFEITTSGEKMIPMRAETEQDRSLWIAKLRAAIAGGDEGASAPHSAAAVAAGSGAAVAASAVAASKTSASRTAVTAASASAESSKAAARAAVAEVNLQLPTKLPKETREAVSAAVNAMPSQESREQAKHLLEKMAGGGKLNNEQLLAAAEDIKETVGSVEVEGDAAITAVAGALQSAASMNEEVCAAVANVLVNTLELAENLPLIGAAAGALGVLIRTFRQTQKDDKNIKTVLLWCASIKDWVLLVAGRVAKSNAKSTISLFEKLREVLADLLHVTETQKKRSFLAKLITTGSFNEHFERCKDVVLLTKEQLKDFLDQEAQDKMEATLADTMNLQIEALKKVDDFSEDLDEMMGLLTRRGSIVVRPDTNEPIPEYEQVWVALRADSGTTKKEIPWKKFVVPFETFFFQGEPMPKEQVKGLRMALDEDKDGTIDKIEWVDFFRRWQHTKVGMDTYLLMLADEAASAPTTMGNAKMAMSSFGATTMSIATSNNKMGAIGDLGMRQLNNAAGRGGPASDSAFAEVPKYNVIEAVDMSGGKAVEVAAALPKVEITIAVSATKHSFSEETRVAVYAAVNAVPSVEGRDQAKVLLEGMVDQLDDDQLHAAALDIQATVIHVEAHGDAAIAAVAGAVQAAVAMDKDVVDAVANLLTNTLQVAQTVPLLGVAAGALGMIIKTFQQTRKDDKNIKNVLLWSASIKDWVLLVAGRVAKSAADSTAPLFEHLKTVLGEMIDIVQQQEGRMLPLKMLTTGSFNTKFQVAKEAVVTTKRSLKDYLDQEALDKMDKALDRGLELQVEIVSKVDALQAQLATMMEQLKTRGFNNPQDPEHLRLWNAMQKETDTVGEPSIQWHKFLLSFQGIFLESERLTKEPRKGLKSAVDPDSDKNVSKVEWVSFYKSWKKSEMDVWDYLLKLADERKHGLKTQTKKLAQSAIGTTIDFAKASNKTGFLKKLGTDSVQASGNYMSNTLNAAAGRSRDAGDGDDDNGSMVQFVRSAKTDMSGGEALAAAAAIPPMKVQLQVGVFSEKTEAAVHAAVNAVPSAEARQQAIKLIEQLGNNGPDGQQRPYLNNEQLFDAATEIQASVGNVEVAGAAAITAVAGAVQAAAGLSREVCDEVSNCVVNVLQLSQSVPMVGMAAGALGMIIKTFQQTKKDDKNIKSVLLWSASIKDWVLLVAGRVARSAGAATGDLFKGLKDAVMDLILVVDKQRGRSRLSKMLTTGSFNEKFEVRFHKFLMAICSRVFHSAQKQVHARSHDCFPSFNVSNSSRKLRPWT